MNFKNQILAVFENQLTSHVGLIYLINYVYINIITLPLMWKKNFVVE